jgi:ABC-2 type transport system permease protein
MLAMAATLTIKDGLASGSFQRLSCWQPGCRRLEEAKRNQLAVQNIQSYEIPNRQAHLMTTGSQLLLLCHVHLRMQRARLLEALEHSRLMVATIGLFLLSYLGLAYWLFAEGLRFVGKLPAAGSLLTDRLIFVLFFCFFGMLVFSVAVTAYLALFRHRDTGWLLSLPFSHEAIFLWKCLEAALFSCWSLVFILAPFLLAFASIREVSWLFFLKSGLLLLPLLVLASGLGALFMIAATRWLSLRQIALLFSGLAIWILISGVVAGLQDRAILEDTGLGAALTFQRVLHHTRLTVHPLMPSMWFSTTMLDWTRAYRPLESALYPALLVSHALMAILLAIFSGKKFFYRSWCRSLHQMGIAATRRAPLAYQGTSAIKRGLPSLGWLMGRPLAAISRKDSLTFWREPAQWIQFGLVFGLLALYASGAKKMNGDLTQPRDLYMVAFLNLGVCAFALSTLTTRFVFPQYSLEGRRLWLLAMAPLHPPRIVLQKFLTSTLATGFLITGILIFACRRLGLPPLDQLFFGTAILLLCVGLNGIAVSLGVLFPNLTEQNTAKIVSGLGGTLCLISSLLYILAITGMLVWLRLDPFLHNEANPDWIHAPRSVPLIAAILTFVTLLTTTLLLFSQKKLKRLEILGNL